MNPLYSADNIKQAINLTKRDYNIRFVGSRPQDYIPTVLDIFEFHLAIIYRNQHQVNAPQNDLHNNPLTR